MQERFWDFTVQFYAGQGVSEALLRLQDECGLDVNILLYAIWRGLSGRSVDTADARAAEAAIAPWRDQVTAPLRDLRRRLKQADWTGLPPGCRSQAEGSFREQIKAIEINSEALTQAALEGLPTGHGPATVADNLAAVVAALAPAGQRQDALALCTHLAQAAAAHQASISG